MDTVMLIAQILFATCVVAYLAALLWIIDRARHAADFDRVHAEQVLLARRRVLQLLPAVAMLTLAALFAEQIIRLGTTLGERVLGG